MLLTISSTLMIFIYITLNDWYFMPQLAFWSNYFYIGPLLILVIGIYKAFVVAYSVGITIAGFPFLFVFTPVLLVLPLCAQIAANFIFWEIQTVIRIKNPGAVHVVKNLMNYNNASYPEVTEMWDHMQKKLRCCGGNGWLTGYEDYQPTPIGSFNNSVPDSCCITFADGCGKNLFQRPKVNIPDYIFVHGCIDVQIQRLEKDIVPLIPALCGILIALTIIEIGLSGLAFFCAKTVWDMEYQIDEEVLSLSQNLEYSDTAYQDSRENVINNFDLIQPSSPSETMC